METAEEKHVGFLVEDAEESEGGGEDSEEPTERHGKLHRRDTPHHLKNKRISTRTSDLEKVASIIAQVKT